MTPERDYCEKIVRPSCDLLLALVDPRPRQWGMATAPCDDYQRRQGFDALTENFGVLVDSSIDPGWLARNLFSYKLISFNLLKETTDKYCPKTADQLRQRLLIDLLERVQCDDNAYGQFLQILRQEAAYDPLANLIEQSYGELPLYIIYGLVCCICSIDTTYSGSYVCKHNFSNQKWYIEVAAFPGLPRFFCTDAEGRRKTRKAWYHSSRAVCQVDVGGGGGGGGGGLWPNRKKVLKKRRRSCVDRLRVSTSRGVFKPSRLDDEQPSGPAETTTGPAPPPYVHPCVHLTSLT